MRYIKKNIYCNGCLGALQYFNMSIEMAIHDNFFLAGNCSCVCPEYFISCQGPQRGLDQDHSPQCPMCRPKTYHGLFFHLSTAAVNVWCGSQRSGRPNPLSDRCHILCVGKRQKSGRQTYRGGEMQPPR
uniref:Uncharacterized protein n=1 Tax=Periophthalmus magnuspinnatus TaxID=409849 RepID=A0A3B4BEG1_9GOBI